MNYYFYFGPVLQFTLSIEQIVLQPDFYDLKIDVIYLTQKIQ